MQWNFILCELYLYLNKRTEYKVFIIECENTLDNLNTGVAYIGCFKRASQLPKENKTSSKLYLLLSVSGLVYTIYARYMHNLMECLKYK